MQVEGEVALEDLRLAVDELVDRDVRPAAGPGPGDDVGPAVTVDVAGGHPHAAGEAHVVWEKAEQWGAVLAGEGEDVGAAAGVGADDDVGKAVTVDVARRHEAAAREIDVKREKVVDLGAVL